MSAHDPNRPDDSTPPADAAHPDPNRPTAALPATLSAVAPATTGAWADPNVTTWVSGAPALADAPPVSARRYELGDEIARGGMGVVYRATDTAFGREVAVKVLQDRFGAGSGAVRRFADEARITGQLQHPAIPPAHDLGALPDGRPFLAMKLIKGDTLDTLLSARPDPSHDRGRFVAAFEQVCQALAYAHAHGVIHRDLKPANVMVGAFGEVQVMDWGLAKVLASGRAGPGRAAGDEPDQTSDGTAIPSPRESDSAFTQAGSVLGTPAYMPPEQAIGAIDTVDPRSDVFGLGAILAVILTGHPPFAAKTAETTLLQAAQGNVGECFARLDASGADPGLVSLCKRCLSKNPGDRPAEAGAVARAVAELRAAADERARKAELDRVKAEGDKVAAELQAAEQAKRRRVVGVAGGLVAAVLLAGLGVSLWQMTIARGERDAKARALEAETAERERAEAAERQAKQERDLKAQALEAEQKARRHAFAAMRTVSEDVVGRKFAQGAVLTVDDRAFLRGVIAQFDAFAAIQGDDADSRAVRAEGRFRVGSMRYQLGELKEAEADYEQAVALRERLAVEFPARPEFRHDLAGSHTSRGLLLKETGRLKEAEAEHVLALALHRQLAADFPSRPDHRNDLAGTCVNLALVHLEQGDLAAARRLLLEGRPHHLAALKANPRHPTYRRNYHNQLSVLTEVHAGLLEKDEAVRAAEARRDVGWDAAADAVDAAGFLSDCIPVVNRHAKLDDGQRMEAARFYADAALKLLRESVARGYKDAAKLKADPSFAPLRDRAEYQTVLADLEAKGR
jgi:hypothetical protein